MTGFPGSISLVPAMRRVIWETSSSSSLNKKSSRKTTSISPLKPLVVPSLKRLLAFELTSCLESHYARVGSRFALDTSVIPEVCAALDSLARVVRGNQLAPWEARASADDFLLRLRTQFDVVMESEGWVFPTFKFVSSRELTLTGWSPRCCSC